MQLLPMRNGQFLNMDSTTEPTEMCSVMTLSP